MPCLLLFEASVVSSEPSSSNSISDVLLIPFPNYFFYRSIDECFLWKFAAFLFLSCTVNLLATLQVTTFLVFPSFWLSALFLSLQSNVQWFPYTLG